MVMGRYPPKPPTRFERIAFKVTMGGLILILILLLALLVQILVV